MDERSKRTWVVVRAPERPLLIYGIARNFNQAEAVAAALNEEAGREIYSVTAVPDGLEFETLDELRPDLELRFARKLVDEAKESDHAPTVYDCGCLQCRLAVALERLVLAEESDDAVRV